MREVFGRGLSGHIVMSHFCNQSDILSCNVFVTNSVFATWIQTYESHESHESYESHERWCVSANLVLPWVRSPQNLRAKVLVASRWQTSKSVPIWGTWHIFTDFQSMSWHVQQSEKHILQGGSSIAGCDQSRREDGQLVSIRLWCLEHSTNVLGKVGICPTNRQLVAMSPWPTHDSPLRFRFKCCARLWTYSHHSSSFFCGVLSIISKGISEKSSRSDALALFVELSLFSRLLKVNSWKLAAWWSCCRHLSSENPSTNPTNP